MCKVLDLTGGTSTIFAADQPGEGVVHEGATICCCRLAMRNEHAFDRPGEDFIQPPHSVPAQSIDLAFERGREAPGDQMNRPPPESMITAMRVG